MSDDIILYVYGPEMNGQSLNSSGVDFGTRGAPLHQDTLKYTNHLSDFTDRVGIVYGGTEDCADFNNQVRRVNLQAAAFFSQGKYVATIKGGSQDVELRGLISNGGTEVDIDLGNWSDQSRERTTGVRLALWKTGGAPVTVRCLNADKPWMEPGSGPYRFIFPQPGKWYTPVVVWLFTHVFYHFT